MSAHEWRRSGSHFEDGVMVGTWICQRCGRKYDADWPAIPDKEALLSLKGDRIPPFLTCDEIQVLNVQEG